MATSKTQSVFFFEFFFGEVSHTKPKSFLILWIVKVKSFDHFKPGGRWLGPSLQGLQQKWQPAQLLQDAGGRDSTGRNIWGVVQASGCPHIRSERVTGCWRITQKVQTMDFVDYRVVMHDFEKSEGLWGSIVVCTVFGNSTHCWEPHATHRRTHVMSFSWFYEHCAFGWNSWPLLWNDEFP